MEDKGQQKQAILHNLDLMDKKLKQFVETFMTLTT
jgi:hypothetical protein